jgi:hypothetical protein
VSSWGTGQQQFMFFVGVAGVLNLYVSTDGSSTSRAIVSSAATPATDGQPLWHRVTWAASTGQTQFFTSSDGATWTQLGVTQSTSPAAPFQSTQWIELGGYNFGNSMHFVGDIYEAEIRSAINGQIIAPTQIDAWSMYPFTEPIPMSKSGAPQLDIWVGAKGGWTISAIQAAIGVAAPPIGQSTTIYDVLHNDGLALDAGSVWATWDSVVNTVETRAPDAGTVMTIPNPKVSPHPALAIEAHYLRSQRAKGYALRRRMSVCDVGAAFAADSRGAAALIQSVDGTHPTDTGGQDGYQLWSDTLLKHYNASA